MALQHLRSSTADKRPTPAAMAEGQLALNTNLASPGLFFKDSNGDLVKVGPVHVGTTAPNATPASGGQSGNSKGEQWLDTSSSRYVFKIWDGSAWRSEDGEFVNASGDTMTGALGIIAGSAASPSVFISGDTNTGIYSPGADQLAISTNGTGRLFVDASGNVALNNDGILNQDNALHFRGTAADDFDAIVRDETNNALVVNSRNSVYINIDSNNDSTNARFAIASNGTTGATTQLLTVQEDGKVGLGTSSAYAKLQVNGDIRCSFIGDGSDFIGWGSGSGTAKYAYISATNEGLQDVGLSFNVTTDAGSSNIEAIRIDDLGNVGIGTTSVNTKFQVANETTTQWSSGLSLSGSTNLNIVATTLNNPDTSITGPETFLNILAGGSGAAVHSIGVKRTGTGTGDLIFRRNVTGGSAESLRIDTSGRLLVGTSSARSVGTDAAPAGLLAEHSQIATSAAYVRNTDDSSGAVVVLAKSRGTASGGTTIVQSNDTAGELRFAAADGVDIESRVASIAAHVDGTPGANDMPGRLVFSTTSDSASSPTERVRITSTGRLMCGQDARNATLETDDQFVINGLGYTAYHALNATAYTIGQNSSSRELRIGSGSGWATTGVSLAAGGTSWGTYSDERLKTDIVELSDCLDSIKDIRCVSYRLTDVDIAESKKRLGIIAQDLVGKYDEAINKSRRSDDDETEYLSVQYTDLVPVLIKALQEASSKIETLEARLTALESA